MNAPSSAMQMLDLHAVPKVFLEMACSWLPGACLSYDINNCASEGEAESLLRGESCRLAACLEDATPPPASQCDMSLLAEINSWRTIDREQGASRGLEKFDIFFSEMGAALRGFSKPAEELLPLASAAQAELDVAMSQMLS